MFIGASIGAVMAFMVGRYLFRGRVEVLARKYPVMQAMDGALMRKGLRIMVLLRLSPLIPFNALNYVLGVMAVEGRDYVVALLAILPGTILYVFIGASAGSLVDGATTVNTVNTTNTTFDGDVDGGGRTVQIVTIVVGIVFGVLGIGAVSYYARKELNSTIETADHPEPNGGITIDIDNNNDGIEIVRQSQIISRV